jgi:broad specificity phosphatase PhoE
VLLVVRHGRTAANAEGLLLGRLDVPLDAEGERQAARLAAAVGPVDRVISSPLLRARQTAAAFGLPVEIDERWVELDYGTYDGTPLREVPDSVWSTWRRDLSFAPPGGESLASLGARVRSSLEELADRARSEHVVVVSHVSPIKAAVAWALGVSDEVTWRLFVAPASITRIELSRRGPVLHTFNEVAHR